MKLFLATSWHVSREGEEDGVEGKNYVQKSDYFSLTMKSFHGEMFMAELIWLKQTAFVVLLKSEVDIADVVDRQFS